MPLIHSGSKAARDKNIETLMGEVGKSSHVKSPAQAQAIAYSIQNRSRANGGVVPGYDMGGGVNPITAALNPTPPMGPPVMPAQIPQMPQPVSAMGVAPSAGAPLAGAVTNPGPMPPAGVAASMMARGGVPGLASGGFDMAHGPNLRPPMYERQEDRQLHVGPILSNVPGRTDNHRGMVPSGSYVLPADLISGRGQGNTMAGMNIFQRAFKLGPYGSSMPSMGHHSNMPRPPRPMGVMASGGSAADGDSSGNLVPVDLAGGEAVIPPENLMQGIHDMLGYRPQNLDHAHRIMDALVLQERAKLVKTLAKLPGPAKD